MAAPENLKTLVNNYEFHRPAYLRGQYNETQLRREFVDKFFSIMGWDVDNNKASSEAYKEVVPINF
jgi:predicted type IV restriction endonuclease